MQRKPGPTSFEEILQMLRIIKSVTGGLYDSLCMRRVVVQTIVRDVKLRVCFIRRNSRCRFEDELRAETGEYTWCMSIFSTAQVKNRK